MPQRDPANEKRAAQEDRATAGPFLVFLYLVLIVAYGGVLFNNPSLRQPGRLIPLTAVVVVHGVLHWFSQRLVRHRRWALPYLLAQGALIFCLGVLTDLQGLIIGLYMALVGESAGVLWPNLRAVALAAFFCLSLLVFNLVVMWGGQALVQSLPMLGSLFLFVLVYVILFMRQAEARERAQELLRELETAHRQLQAYASQIEELTISQERERMAQELHDTLAQGLAGLILQLEAADSHLESGDANRAQGTVQQAMERARGTLREARRAIQALRPAVLESGNLVDALGEEIERFSATSGVHTTFQVDASPADVSSRAAQEILRIVQESLTNVARHAQASHVVVQLDGSGDALRLTVQDDGAGFETAEGWERPGCFGLVGMRERAERIGGVLQVESELGKGTTVVLEMERTGT